tara:strand:+ start:19718 stop:20431 length:714 start_codon:yes stop_codon:yes gene_type:complete
MTEIQRSVATGHTHYRYGTVPVDRAQALADRFERRYGLGLSEDQRSHARRKKKATYRLVMFPDPHHLCIHWWLMRSPGSHIDDQRKWHDVRVERITWPWWYELVRLPVDPAHRAKYAKQPGKGRGGKSRINAVTWTWRIQKSVKHRLKDDVRFYITKSDQRLLQLLKSLRQAPGFRGVRQDLMEIYGFVRRQCNNSKVAQPEMPKTIRWVRNQRYARVPLSVLIRRAEKGEASWFPA